MLFLVEGGNRGNVGNDEEIDNAGYDVIWIGGADDDDIGMGATIKLSNPKDKTNPDGVMKFIKVTMSSG